MDLDFGNDEIRRLPIYLLIGTPGSMTGAPIQAVNQGVNLLYNELMNDPTAIETVHISVIAFDNEARLVTPLTELTAFSPPSLNAGGEECATGAALQLLRESLDRDIVPNTRENKGDYKALVLLMTDSQPTDTDVWDREAKLIRERSWDIAAVVALACGERVDTSTLKRLTEAVFSMDSVSSDAISRHFKWVSQSVRPAEDEEEGSRVPVSLVSEQRPLTPPGDEPDTSDERSGEEEELEVVRAPAAITPQVSETDDMMVCVLDDGTTVECEAEPFAEGAGGTLHWDKAGTHVVKLYKDPTPELRSSLQKLISPETNVTHGSPYWDRLFAWPKAIIEEPTLGVTMLRAPKGAMELKWFLDAKSRRIVATKHGPEKLGSWVNALSITVKLARVVRHLHTCGLVHTDLSFRTFLVDPQQSRVVWIGCDSVMVPGVISPRLVGTPLCMAPELVSGMTSPERRLDLSQRTDLHSLATLIYWTLFRRHPLRGPKQHHSNPTNDEALALGEGALFIEHPTDTSNRPEDLQLPYTVILTPAVQRLIERAFIDGLHEPEKRPTAAEWERDLVRMADLIVPCSNAKCPLKAFVLPEATSVGCPACDTPLNNPPVLPILHFYRPIMDSKGEFQNDDGYVFVGWPGHVLHVWHTDATKAPGPGVDTTAMARLAFDAAGGRWKLTNEAIDGLRILREDGKHRLVAVESACELVDGMQLLLGRGDTARLALVRLKRLTPGSLRPSSGCRPRS